MSHQPQPHFNDTAPLVQSTEALACKKTYSRPELTVFGSVSALTQSGSSSCTNDGANCTLAPGSAMGMASDIHLKQNIVQIGQHARGFGLYLYEYVAPMAERLGAGRHFGVLAQEVQSVMPEAVMEHADGYKTVDYAKLGICLVRH